LERKKEREKKQKKLWEKVIVWQLVHYIRKKDGGKGTFMTEEAGVEKIQGIGAGVEGWRGGKAPST